MSALDMDGVVLAEIFERKLSLDAPLSLSGEASLFPDALIDLWEDMAAKLDTIAANSMLWGQQDQQGQRDQQDRRGIERKKGVANNQKSSIGEGRAQSDTMEGKGLYVGSGAVEAKGTTTARAPLAQVTVDEGLSYEAMEPHKIVREGRDKKPSPVKVVVADNQKKQKEKIRGEQAQGQEGSKKERSPLPTTKEQGKKAKSGPVNAENEARKITPKPIEGKEATSIDTKQGKTASQEALERSRAAAEATKQGNTLADALKKNLGAWDGSSLVSENNLEEATGLAAGGPVYAAVKEVVSAVEDQGDDNSLLGALKKTLQDKTGVTALKERASSVKDGATEKILRWAGGEGTADRREKKSGATRDKNGRFIKQAEKKIATEHIEISTETLDLANKEAKKEEDRHKELIRAVSGVGKAVRGIDAGGNGGGLLGGLADFFGGNNRRGGRNRRQNFGGRQPRSLNPAKGGGRFARLRNALGSGGGRLGSFVRTGAKGLGIAGATILGGGGIADLGMQAAEAFASRNAPVMTTVAAEGALASGAKGAATATKGVAGGVSKAAASGGGLGAKLGIKALGKAGANAAKLIPVIGQALTIGMAAYDGVQGWSDTEAQAKAFDLKEGEEASFSQKMSTATANVLDMGGLLTGAAGLLGFDVDTADLARGLYDVSQALTPIPFLTDIMGSLCETSKDALEEEKQDDKMVGVANIHVAGATGTAAASAVPVPNYAKDHGPRNEVVAQNASASIEASTQAAMERGVRYGFGSKNSQSGAIDCSGWVAEINRNMMDSMNKGAESEVYGEKAKRVLAKGASGGAAGLIQAVTEATGEQLGNADLTPDKVREGLMIGMDTGDKGWDAGRYGGIDHIVQTYRDQETGQMMVSESSGSKGVHSTSYEEWYAKWGEKATLHGTDIGLLAEASPSQNQSQNQNQVENYSQGSVLAQTESQAPIVAEGQVPNKVPNKVPNPVPAEAQSQAQSLSITATDTVTQQGVEAVATPNVLPHISSVASIAGPSPEGRGRHSESVADIAPPQDFGQGNGAMQTGKIEQLLQAMLDVMSKNTPAQQRASKNDSVPQIAMDFDDPAALRFAHDMG